MSLLINVIRLKTCAQNCAKKKRDTPRMRNVSLYFLGFTLGDAVIKRWC